MKIRLPGEIEYVLNRLNARGFEAYVVGGCVRDTLLGRRPQDWDVCTSALPEETKACFADGRTLDTGLQHGTVTVLVGHVPVEVTTYRVDGAYSDHRHPDQVAFTRSLKEDLARRDLTINAMAYHPAAGIQDPWGGQADLRRCLIRTVGDPDKRFTEDALRILRALRFSAQLGFPLVEETAGAVEGLADTCALVAPERRCAEFRKLILGRFAGPVLVRYREPLNRALGCQLPLAEPARLAAVGAAGPGLPPRLALSFWPAGGPALEGALRALRFDTAVIRETCACAGLLGVLETGKGLPAEFAELADSAPQRGRPAPAGSVPPLSPVQLRLLVRDWGVQAVRDGLDAAGALGRQEAAAETARLQELVQAGVCMDRSGLAVTGRDLIAAGVPEGRAVGRTLEELLSAVILGRMENSRDALLAAVKARRAGR